MPRTIFEIETRGRHSSDDYKNNQWVKSYKIRYSNDGVNWVWYNSGEILQGNTDHDSSVRHKLIPFQATAVRIYPVAFNEAMSMRFEVYFR